MNFDEFITKHKAFLTSMPKKAVLEIYQKVSQKEPVDVKKEILKQMSIVDICKLQLGLNKQLAELVKEKESMEVFLADIGTVSKSALFAYLLGT